MQLYNKLSAIEQAELIDKAGKSRLTISFYKYAHIGNPQVFRDHLFINLDKLGVLGRTYIAKEGINAQISVPSENMLDLKTFLDSIIFLKDIRLNVAIEQDNKSFLKLKVKVRDKIVADGLNDETFDSSNCGVHVNAEEFNKLVNDPNSIVVDMRNHYESEIGHFKNAITPDVDTFRDSLDIIEEQLKDHKEDKKLVMYCTGGIRCEKASAYYKHKGFKDVYQLEGGIINYVKQVNEQGLENNFMGSNFVFDHRKAERVSDDIVSQCHQCGEPWDLHENCLNQACHLLFIQCPKCIQKMDGCCSDDCKKIAALPFEEQKELRKGIQDKGNLIFKKGRSQVLKFKK